MILLISIFFIKDFRIDASSDTLVAQNDSDFKYFSNYSKLFKTENFLVVAVKTENKVNESFVNKFKILSSKINKLESVKSVFSFIDAPIFFLNQKTLSSLEDTNIETIINSDFNIDEILKEFSNNPIYKDQIINSKGNVFSLVIYLKKNIEFEKTKEQYKNNKILKKKYLKSKNTNDQKRNFLISDIRKIIKEADNEYKYYLGGIDMIASDVINFVKKDILIFSLSVTLIIIFVLFVIFREIKWVFICLFTSAYAVTIIFGTLGYSKLEVTAISSNFAALIFILSISMNIHIINYYKLLGSDAGLKIKKTINNMFWPCLYTTLTTIVAFASLMLTNIIPIIDFGLIMIISLIISFVCSFTILPLFLFVFPKINLKNKNILILNNKFINLPKNNSKYIILISFFLFLLSIFGISKLSVENSFVNYFKKNTEIYKGMKLIDEELGGTTPLDIVLIFEDNKKLIMDDKNNEEDLLDDKLIEDDLGLDVNIFDEEIFSEDISNVWFTKDKLQIISDIHNYLESKKEIGKVQSVKSLIDLANLINKEKLELFELSILYNKIPENYKERLIYPYLLIDKNMTRISARVRDSENINRKKLIRDINSFIEEKNYSSLTEYKVNGLLVLYNNMLKSLFDSQIKSLGFIIFLIFMMFIILFKSVKLSIVAIIPNIFASSFILGIIGYLSIPLDIMTITIAAITIGIAVDNTIHYLYRYKEYKKKNNMLDSIVLTNSTAGLAVLTTSTTIALGFSVLSLSSFIPTVLFGIFTSLAMIFAMIGVLILLPSLLIKIK